MHRKILALLALLSVWMAIPAPSDAQGASSQAAGWEAPYFDVTNQVNTVNTGIYVAPPGARFMTVQFQVLAFTGTTPTLQINVQRWNGQSGAFEEWAIESGTHSTGGATYSLTIGPYDPTGLNQTDTNRIAPLPRRFRVQIIEGGSWTDLDGFIYVNYFE